MYALCVRMLALNVTLQFMMLFTVDLLIMHTLIMHNHYTSRDQVLNFS